MYLINMLNYSLTQGVKLTSTHTQLPYEYYSVKLCPPPSGKIIHESENLGEVLRGDRIVNTNYQVNINSVPKISQRYIDPEFKRALGLYMPLKFLTEFTDGDIGHGLRCPCI